jgi:phosphohistidine phosphatase
MGPGPRLIVMRHAQAGELPGGPDAERALRPGGRRDAAAAGSWLRGQRLVPDAVICSTARRARQTWLHLSAQFGLGTGPGAGIKVSNDPRLYEGTAGQILPVIGSAGPGTAILLYIGHNPAARQLVAELTGQRPEFAAGSIAVVELSGGWASAAPGTGRLAASWSPGPG